jgi:hypothetical protein
MHAHDWHEIEDRRIVLRSARSAAKSGLAAQFGIELV